MKFIKTCGFLLVASCLVRGQEQTAASIEGFVTSDPAVALAGATVRLDSLAKSYHRETQTNATGHYSLEELQPGAYSLCAEIRGLGCIIYPHIALMPNQRMRQDFVFVRAKRTPRACEPPEKSRTGR